MLRERKIGKLRQRLCFTNISGQQTTHVDSTGKATAHTGHLASRLVLIESLIPEPPPPTEDYGYVENSQEFYDEERERLDDFTDYVDPSNPGKRKYTVGVYF